MGCFIPPSSKAGPSRLVGRILCVSCLHSTPFNPPRPLPLQLLRPFLLRRIKDEVETNLPPRVREGEGGEGRRRPTFRLG